ncbi:MAG: hypothetical protein ACOVMN_05925 [Flexibacteraceae bacterium]
MIYAKSIGISLLLFVAVIALQNLAGAWGASVYGFSSVVYLNNIHYLVDSYGWKSYGAVILAYLSGTAFIGIIGTIGYGIYRTAWKRKQQNLGFFMGWLHLVCYLWVFADIVSGEAMRKGPYFGFNFLLHKYQLSDNLHFVIAGIAILALYITGGLSAYRMLRALPSISLLLQKGNKNLTLKLLLHPVGISVIMLGISYSLIGDFNLRFMVNLLFVSSAVLVGYLVCERFKDITVLKYRTVGKPLNWIITAVIAFGLALIIFGSGYQFN